MDQDKKEHKEQKDLKDQCDSPPSQDLDFAPRDLTDGRRAFDWQSRWPAEARKRIGLEGLIVVAYLLVSMVCLWVLADEAFVTMYANPGSDISAEQPLRQGQFTMAALMCGLSGLAAGTLFSVKWLYHSVAKGNWNEDRIYWRLLTPIVSGVLAFMMFFLLRSNIFAVFDPHSIAKPSTSIAVGFIVGYFSDTALAKMAEVANSLFGVTSRHSDVGSPKSEK